MTTDLYKKCIIFVIIALFVGASTLPSISGKIDQRSNDKEIPEIITFAEIADVGKGKIRIDTRPSISILGDELHDDSVKWDRDEDSRISGRIKYDLTYYKQPSSRPLVYGRALVNVRPYCFKGLTYDYDLNPTRHWVSVPDDNLIWGNHSFEIKLLYDDLTSKEKQDKEFTLTFVITAMAWCKLGQIFPEMARQSKNIHINVTFD